MVKNGCLLILALLFLSLNIFLSQELNSDYVGLINGNEKSFVDFLIKIRPLADFDAFYKMGQKIYGIQINNQVFQEQISNQKQISHLQSLLVLNPKQKNLLYNLALLYKEKGDSNLAREYFAQAKLIDPEVK